MDKLLFCPSCMRTVPQGAEICPACGKSVFVNNDPHQLPVGTLLKERYEVGRTIGQGGFGITYIGKDRVLDLVVAIKEYYPSDTVNRICSYDLDVTVSSREEETYQQGKLKFLAEARTLAIFTDEPGVVWIRDFFEENDTAYIVMEYLDGVSLEQKLKVNGPMSFEKAYGLLRPVMRSLKRVHANGLVHRDISPANLMLLKNGTVKLLDFGTARVMNADGEKSLSVVMKPGFAPEEQYDPHGVQGPWTDVYALCATMYKLMTGETPVNSLSRALKDTMALPSEKGALITPAQEQVLMRGMAVKRQDRIQNMQELMEAFDKAGEIKAAFVPASERIVDQSGDDERTVFAVGGDVSAVDSGVSSSLNIEDKTVAEVRPESVSDRGMAEPVFPGKQAAPGKTAQQDIVLGKKKNRKKLKWAVIVPIALIAVLAAVFVSLQGNVDPYREGTSSSVYFENQKITPSMLKKVLRDPKALAIHFTGCEIDENCIKQFTKITRSGLGALYFEDTELPLMDDIASVDSIRELFITFSGAKEFDGSQVFTVPFERITWLTVSGPELVLTDGGQFMELFPNVSWLELEGTKGLQEGKFLDAMPKLNALEANGSDLCSSRSDKLNLPALYKAEMMQTGLKDLSIFEDCTQMTRLAVDGNELTDLDPCWQMIKLAVLRANGNHLKDISGLSNCTLLENVYLADNDLTDVSVLAKSAKHLKRIDLSFNPISDLSFLEGASEVTVLAFAEAKVSDLSPLSGCPQLNTLVANGNEIVDLTPLSGMPLKRLDLGENLIEDISPLAECAQENYSWLLQNNRITDISALSKDIEFDVLSLYNNPITDFSPFEGMRAWSASSPLYVSYAEEMDFSYITNSYIDKVKLVDTPLDQIEPIKEINRTEEYQPEDRGYGKSEPVFISYEEAEEDAAKVRYEIREEILIWE